MHMQPGSIHYTCATQVYARKTKYTDICCVFVHVLYREIYIQIHLLHQVDNIAAFYIGKDS